MKALPTTADPGTYALLFAPVDAAWDQAATDLGTTVDALLADTAKLTEILLLHASPEPLTTEAMTDGQVLPTLAPGQTVTVSKAGDTVRIIPPAGEAFAATIVPGGSNVATSNGILQKIDRVRGRGGAEAARALPNFEL